MEFVLVGALLTVLVLAVLQVGLATYVRTVLQDAAVEGAHHAALVGATGEDGAERTRSLITRTVGEAYASGVSVREELIGGRPSIVVRVRAAIPVIGMVGIPGGWDLSAHAPREGFSDAP